MRFGIVPGCAFLFVLSLTYGTDEYHYYGSDPVDYPSFRDFRRPVVINKELVKHWADSLSDYLTTITKNLTAYKELLDIWSSYSQNKTWNVTTVIAETAKNINDLLQNKAKAVQDLVKKAEEATQNHTYDKHLKFDYLNNKKLLSDGDLKKMKANMSDIKYRYIVTKLNPRFNNLRVNLNFSTVHVPTNVFDKAPIIMNGVAWSEALNEQFVENEKKYPRLTWQYFCSSDGFFRIFPGMKWARDNQGNNIDMFDCRVRPWYIKGSTSPKNVVILVDTSGSMKGLRMEITRSTINNILNTLSEDDYFNVIQFSKTTKYTDPCFNGTMMQANKENRERMAEYIKTMETKNIAYFDVALKEAFDLFEKEEAKLLSRKYKDKEFDKHTVKSTHLCNKIIMILTDGAPEEYEEIFKQRNWDFKTGSKKVRVFTYLIGREVSDNRNAKWMACANKGYYTHISTLADVQENVQQYLKVLSRPLVIKNATNQIWTPLYADYTTEVSPDFSEGLKFMTSFAMPVYDKSLNNNKGKLLGVMGTDVPIEQIKSLLPIRHLGPNGYAFIVRDHDYVLFHPNLRPFYFKEDGDSKILALKLNYSNVDVTQVEYIPKSQFKQLQKFIRVAKPGSKQTFKHLVVPYDKRKRVAIRSYDYYIHQIGDTSFKLIFALPLKYGNIHHWIGKAEQGTNKQSMFVDYHTKFAPWRYCNSDQTLMTKEPERRFVLHKLFYDQTNKCTDGDFILDLGLLYLNRKGRQTDVRESWEAAACYMETGRYYKSLFDFPQFYAKHGIELLFLWTRSGITRYRSGDEMPRAPEDRKSKKKTGYSLGDDQDNEPPPKVPAFIEKNTRTVENPYYKKAIEGKIENGYDFTFSIPIDGSFNPLESVVTVTLPVAPSEHFVPLVLGLQMKYTKFQEIFEQKALNCGGIIPCDLTCYNDSVECYILDNNGFMMARVPNVTDPLEESPLGHFFGDYDNILMSELVQKEIYTEHNFIDYQAMCETTTESEEGSSASSLLNPFRKLFNGFFWLMTEIAIFYAEWSFSGWWESFSADAKAMCGGGMPEVYKLEEMDNYEIELYYQSRPKCPTKSAPVSCHKNITLYRLNVDEFKMRFMNGHSGTIVQVCDYCPPYNRTWNVQWIKNTNLIFLMASLPPPPSSDPSCRCRSPSEAYSEHASFPSIAGKKIKYTRKQFCKRLTKSSRDNRMSGNFSKPQCMDTAEGEDDTHCGQSSLSISGILLLICAFISTYLYKSARSYL